MVTARDRSDEFQIDPVPAGMHKAVCIGIFDLGHQRNYFGEIKHEVCVMWEIPDIRIKTEEQDLPRVISRRYNLSLDDRAHLRRHLQAWRGKPFEKQELEGFRLENILGAPCILNIVQHRSKKNADEYYSMVDYVAPMPKGEKRPKPETPQMYFSFEDKTVIPATAPKWLTKKIMESEEWRAMGTGSNNSTPPPEDDLPPEDDIPF